MRYKFNYQAQNDLNYDINCFSCINVYSRRVKDRDKFPCACDPEKNCCIEYYCPLARTNQFPNIKIKLIQNVNVQITCSLQLLAPDQFNISIETNKNADRLREQGGRREPSSANGGKKREIQTKGGRKPWLDSAKNSYRRAKEEIRHGKRVEIGRDGFVESNFRMAWCQGIDRVRSNTGNKDIQCA